MAAKDTSKTATKPVTTTPTFLYDEVLKKCLEYFDGDELAATTWMNKYAMKNGDGNYIETSPDDMHKRMAKQFARIETKYGSATELGAKTALLSDYGQQRHPMTKDEIYNLFRGFKYVIPQGSVMAALGNTHMLASLSNCVVIPEVYDSYGGIMYTDQQLVQLFKRRCGVGLDMSTIRPSGLRVNNAAGSTSGAVSFMERFSNTTREVSQNGRRGALMITMDITHPDVEDFVTIKQDLTKVTGANVSVRISDEFMKAVRDNKQFTHRWPIDAKKPKITKKVNARELWNTIIQCAHNTAEPGLIFWDRQHYYSTSSVYPEFKNTSTNPCSEIAMQGGDSCRLIAINLYSFVEEPFTENAKFNHKKFWKTTYEAQRLMDDLVDLELEAIERILDKVKSDPEPDHIKQVEIDTWQLLYDAGKKGRRTGLGFTALADACAALGLKFDSDEALAEMEQMMRTKCDAEFNCSIDMAIERGQFEAFDKKIEDTSEFVQMLKKEFPNIYERMMQHGRRNISISTVAPTGTLSMLAQTSSGIEPVFLTSYKRRRKIMESTPDANVSFVDELGDRWEEFTVYHPKLKTWMNINNRTDDTGNPYDGSTAPEIDWVQRVKLQAMVQKYVTHSISSTINLPENVSQEKVGDIYLKSWEQGVKGITVYRDGSRSGVLISTEEKKEEAADAIVETRPPRRPKKLEAEVVRFQNDKEKWIAVIGLLNGKPYEIFTGKAEEAFHLPAWAEKGWIIKDRDEDGNARYDFQYTDKDGYRITIEGLSRSFDKEFWNYAKLISGVLRHGMPLPYVVNLVSRLNLFDENINTWKNGVERTLKRYIPDGTKADHKCPSCNDPDGLIYEEGCLKCKSCGHSKCG
jgi:ribonucleoside-diphosphate reductase alpha chain